MKSVSGKTFPLSGISAKVLTAQFWFTAQGFLTRSEISFFHELPDAEVENVSNLRTGMARDCPLPCPAPGAGPPDWDF
jgi:hypothetical protein